MTKINLPTLARNIAQAKQRKDKIEAKYSRLTSQLVARVGTGGQTITTPLGLVIVTEQTQDRVDKGFVIRFDEDAFLNLEPMKQAELVKLGIIKTEKKIIMGQAPKVQVRLNNGQ